MGNRAPPGTTFLQRVDVNGLNHHPAWDDLGQTIYAGEYVQLVKVDNPHDANAVAVEWSGRQIGWVPKLCNHEIAARLRKGQKLTAVVTNRSNRSLTIDVFRPEDKDRPNLIELHRHDRFTGTITLGKLYRCHTTSTRSSVSIINKAGDVAWFRKSEMPDWDYPPEETWVKIVSTIPLRGQLVHGVPVPNNSAEDLSVESSTTNAKKAIHGAIEEAHQKHINAMRYVVDTTFGSDLPETLPIYGYSDGSISISIKPKTQSPITQKETTMSISSIVNSAMATNKTAAAQAGYLEAGRIANNKLTQVAGKTLPLMARGYADTPLGRLLLANAAVVAVQQLRPNDPTLNKLTNAMVVSAYQEAFQHLDLEGMLDNFLGSDEIKSALSKVEDKKGGK